MKILNIFYITIIIYILSGCSSTKDNKKYEWEYQATEVDSQAPSQPPPPPPTPPPLPTIEIPRTNNEYKILDIYYATDRQRNGHFSLNNYYTGQRDLENNVKYGVTQVTIPSSHKPGFIETPSIWRLEFSENQKKHITIQDVNEYSKNDFFYLMNAKLNNKKEKSAFIFIHGYNVTFADAAKRTGQLAYDLGFQGVPILYSWPSMGETSKYTYDESNIKWSKLHIKNFLLDLSNISSIENIYLIAHSMGTRGLTRAYISALNKSPLIKNKIREIILAAPDIDADVFKSEIAPEMSKLGVPITLYSSSNDKALKASKIVHGRPRAGDAGKDLILLPEIENIDSSSINTDFLGHSYFSNEKNILNDIFYLIHQNLRANERAGLERVSTNKGTYWKFK